MPKPVRRATKIAQTVEKSAHTPPQQIVQEKADWRETISTGSLLLDKAISGNKTRYGGIPGGFLVEIFGPNSVGKTTLLGELWGNAQRAGGECRFDDPEHRLDADYCKTFGIKVNQEDIGRPETVEEVFDTLIGPVESRSVGSTVKNKRNTDKAWKPDPSKINFLAEDSLAALAGRMEMEQGDKMGSHRAKEFSEGLRLAKGHISKYNIIMACSNQLRIDIKSGAKKPTGGEAIPFYASVRISLKLAYPKSQLIKKIKLGPAEREEERIYGILVEATVVKNSLDAPYRSAPLRLLFNYGVDDIGANLQWLKDHGAFDSIDERTGKVTKASSYQVGDKKYVSLEAATKAVEDQNLEQEIRDLVVDLWDEIEDQIRPKRKEKYRG